MTSEQMNGAAPHQAGPGAFIAPETEEQRKKRLQNERYKQNRRELMEAGRQALRGRGGNRVNWTDEMRKAASERMKKAHAAKPDWKRANTLRRLGYLPLEEKAKSLADQVVEAHRVAPTDPEAPYGRRANGKAYKRGPYQKTLERMAPLVDASRAVQGLPPIRSNDRMLGVLIDTIREELKDHIKAGGEITPFHTSVLALTDYLRKRE